MVDPDEFQVGEPGEILISEFIPAGSFLIRLWILHDGEARLS